ncbi:hypothetical protein JKF63_00100 [Porcisia hertigi]|uniref:DDT domain-containing protein n=1 Tax=Porcisia hertigi TaxID=2761500 RepID=A0A836KWS5_9TRYP|nr:hypothetical protein JKF63_00100 [Porcisia hertigi]
MITARSPYQVYKATDVTGSVAEFSSLPSEELLPYKIASSEETLVASLTVVESSEDLRSKYAVSVLHAASAYISDLISYIPLSLRSQTAKRVQVNLDAIVRTVMLFATKSELLQSVKNMLLVNAQGEQVSLKDLSELEDVLNVMEKEFRQKAKGAGEKVDMLRKVAPEPVVVSANRPKIQCASPSAAGDENGEAASDLKGSSAQRRRRSLSTDGPAANGELQGDAAALKVAKIEGDGRKAPLALMQGRKPAGGPKSAHTSRRGGLLWGRLRALTSNEKKVVAMLHSTIQVLGHIFASKFNDLVPIFDILEERFRAIQAIVNADREAYKAKGDKKLPEPFHDVTLDGIQLALEESSDTFRNDEECRYELDEDLLHPIAHACLQVINQIEGFLTDPFKAPTPEELAKKQQLRDASRAKRDDAKRRMLERVEAKAELERKKEEERQLIRQRLGDGGDGFDDDLEEDTTIVNPSTLGYVAYATKLPLETPDLYEKALYIWSMLVSLPRALNLSQMHFATFLKGIQCDDQDANGLMEEVTRSLLDVSLENVRVRSPDTPRIMTRRKNWFDALVEFVGVASGNKKRRQQQQRQRRASTTEDDEDEETDSDADTSSSTSSSSSSSPSSAKGRADDKSDEVVSSEPKEKSAANEDNVENGTAQAVVEEEADTDPFSLELKETMEKVAALRTLASWGNVDVVDRLNLLQFCVQEALTSDNVRSEADRLQRDREDEMLNAEKKLKEIREEAERDLKALLRTLPAATAQKAKKAPKSKQNGNSVKTRDTQEVHNAKQDGQGGEEGENAQGALEQDPEESAKFFEAEREAILKGVDRKREEVYARLFSVQDGQDNGAIIEPLGMDRYRRLYWRFPLERVVYVQSVPDFTTATFPVLAEPPALEQRSVASRLLLLDDEESALQGGRRRGARGAAGVVADTLRTDNDRSAVQTRWGVIPNEHLSAFIQTLDRRGEREASLRRALEPLVPYLKNLQEPREGRETRARAHMFGYLNRLKVDFTF